jgi:hypothetical protein
MIRTPTAAIAKDAKIRTSTTENLRHLVYVVGTPHIDFDGCLPETRNPCFLRVRDLPGDGLQFGEYETVPAYQYKVGEACGGPSGISGVIGQPPEDVG